MTVKRHFSGFVRILLRTSGHMSCGSCMISKRATGFSYQEAAEWCMERQITRTGNLIYLLVKQNTFHYWIGAAKKKKKVSFPFALGHVRRMFLFGVPLRFWIKRLLMAGEELSPQLWDFWGNVGKLDLFLSLFVSSGLTQPQLWGTKSWFSQENRSFGWPNCALPGPGGAYKEDGERLF